MADNPMNVRDLIPSFCEPRGDEITAGLLRQAFRAHIMFQLEAGGVALPVAQIVHVADRERVFRLSCEHYSRAILESLFAAYFDGENPRTDRTVFDALRGYFGHDFAGKVREAVHARGVAIPDPIAH